MNEKALRLAMEYSKEKSYMLDEDIEKLSRMIDRVIDKVKHRTTIFEDR